MQNIEKTAVTGRTETMIGCIVTYTLKVAGKVFIIENVPGWVCEETGKEYFSPKTVEKVHALVHGGSQPKRVIETPVYEFEP